MFFFVCLIVIVVAWMGLRWILPTLRKQRNWVCADAVSPCPFEIDDLPEALREKVTTARSQLKALGFEGVGSCRWNLSRQVSCFVVMTRDDFVAELSFALVPHAHVWITIGQEYSDGTSLFASNLFYAEYAPNEFNLRLPRVNDPVKLDFVARSLVERHRKDRVARVPTDACLYKAGEIPHRQQEYAKSRYYRLDKKRNRYRPNWRYFLFTLHGNMFRSKAAVRSRYWRDVLKLNLILKDLGCGSLESLQSPQLRAFPVIVSADTVTGAGADS